jgi:protein-L-isoaspartate(D-aspartate) O-methyltransferase
VLDAFTVIPREHFVDQEYKALAFADTHVPLINGDVMMTPIQEALMLQALNVQPGEQVLEVGTGSGFVTACLVHLGGKVTSYEIDSHVSAHAAERLHTLGMDDAVLVVGDIFSADLPDEGFDVIAVTGSVPEPSEKLERLLAPGGRLFQIKGEDPVMTATLTTKNPDGSLRHKGLTETALPPLKNAPKPKTFVF